MQVAVGVFLATGCGGSRAVGTSERGRGINTCTACETEVNTDIQQGKYRYKYRRKYTNCGSRRSERGQGLNTCNYSSVDTFNKYLSVSGLLH